MIVVQSRVLVGSNEFISIEALDTGPAAFDLLEGSLEIVADGRPILGSQHWDYLVLIWFSMAQALSELRAGGAGTLQFPDQPMQLELRQVAGGVRLHLRHTGSEPEVVVSEPEFVQAVRARGKEFFEAALRLFPANQALFNNQLAVLLQDPPGAVLSDVPWEIRLDHRQVGAIRPAERSLGRSIRGLDLEMLIFALAGRPDTFAECVARVIDISEQQQRFRSSGSSPVVE